MDEGAAHPAMPSRLNDAGEIHQPCAPVPVAAITPKERGIDCFAPRCPVDVTNRWFEQSGRVYVSLKRESRELAVEARFPIRASWLSTIGRSTDQGGIA